jgi:chemotaxis protein CheX
VISEDDLIQIAEDICLSLFADGDGAAHDAAAGAAAGPATMTAVVDIHGDWNASVLVTCDQTTAVGLASVMFAAPGPELSRNDVVDALGEFANMAGGAVKGMYDGEKTLGLPTVTDDADPVRAGPDAVEVAGVDFGMAGTGTVRLAVHEHLTVPTSGIAR